MGNPTVTPFVENWHNGGFLVSEANGHLSRDSVTLLAGTKYLAGMVLGKITAGLTAASAVMGANTGNGVFGAVTLVTVPTMVGTYTAVWTDATHFTVTAPNGKNSAGVIGTEFAALGLKFTMSAGATAMVAGDYFNIVVTATPGKPTATATAATANTGNATSSAVVSNGYAPKVGQYKVFITEPGSGVGMFQVEDPDGKIVGDGVVAGAFAGGGLSFTIADGSTDFAAGDGFTVTVADGSGKFTVFDPGSAIGADIPAGILFGAKDATSADKPGLVIARQAEVNASELLWMSGMSAAQVVKATAQLASIGIIAR